MNKLWMNNLISKTVSNIYRLLTPVQRKKSIILISLIFTLGILDVFGLASVLPIIFLTTKSNLIFTNPYLFAVYSFFNFPSANIFILFIFGIVVLIFTSKNILGIWINYTQIKFSYDVAQNLTTRKLKQFYLQKITTINETNSSVYATNILATPTELSSGLMVPLFSLFSELIVIFLIVVAISIYDFKLLFLLSAILIPTSALFYRIIRTRAHKMGLQKNNSRYYTFQYLYQIIHGYIDVTLMNKRGYFSKKFVDKNKEFNKSMVELTFFDTIPNRYIEVIALMAVFMIFAYSVLTRKADSGFITFLAIFVTAAYRIMPSFNRIIVATVKLKSSQIVFDILKDVPQDETGNDDLILVENNETIVKPPFERSIELRNVYYTYEGNTKYALSNISVSIKKGEIIGFVGTSGSGKTTLFNILLRLLKEQQGSFLLDEKVLHEKMLDGWRKMIGYVRQDYFLLDASLAENITFGLDADQIDKVKLEKCIRLASLEAFVKSLPNGVDTHIGEKGGKLSGGQKQRIAIARSLYQDAEIILFDEATSALDHETENEIIETINNLSSEKKTMLMIAHRYTTLRKCDKIYEMRNGEIIGEHSYDELIKKHIIID
jgi:ABC-type multidrug transport system fused ATPase/permease subunit